MHTCWSRSRNPKRFQKCVSVRPITFRYTMFEMIRLWLSEGLGGEKCPDSNNQNPNTSAHLMLMDVFTRKSGSAQHGSRKKFAHITLYRLELMIDLNSSWPYHTSTIRQIHIGLFTFARKSKILWFHFALRGFDGVGAGVGVGVGSGNV